MSSPPPTKPPRGVKQGKETSGLLMSVIRTLSASETNEQREKERAKLEKEYKKSDARLDELVAAHSQEITQVMQRFASAGAALGAGAAAVLWAAAGCLLLALIVQCCRTIIDPTGTDYNDISTDDEARPPSRDLVVIASVQIALAVVTLVSAAVCARIDIGA